MNGHVHYRRWQQNTKIGKISENFSRTTGPIKPNSTQSILENENLVYHKGTGHLIKKQGSSPLIGDYEQNRGVTGPAFINSTRYKLSLDGLC